MQSSSVVSLIKIWTAVYEKTFQGTPRLWGFKNPNSFKVQWRVCAQVPQGLFIWDLGTHIPLIHPLFHHLAVWISPEHSVSVIHRCSIGCLLQPDKEYSFGSCSDGFEKYDFSWKKTESLNCFLLPQQHNYWFTAAWGLLFHLHNIWGKLMAT